jgi:multiple sugar transport system substrate-binding protein
MEIIMNNKNKKLISANCSAKSSRVKISRRQAIQSIGAVAGVAALGINAPYINAKQKTIRFLNGEPSVQSVRAMRFAAAQYEKETGVKVQMDTIPAGKAYQKVQTSIKGGNPYDIATLIFLGDVLILADEKKLVPLNDIIKKYDWGPRILFPMDGNNYWYPYDYNFCWINYRMDLYKKAGLKEPKNWQQLSDNMAALIGGGEDKTDKGIVHPIASSGATNYTSFGYMWAQGVELFDENWNVILDSPDMKKKAVEYLDFFESIVPKMPDGLAKAGWGVLVSGIQTGQLSHCPGTGRLIDVINAKNPELASNIGIFPFPSSDGRNVALNHGYDGWVVLDTAMSDEALKFLEWFSDEHLINFLHTSPVHYQPTRLDIYEDPRWLSHPDLEKFSHITRWQKQFITDPNVIIRSIDTEGPNPDVRAGKAFRSYALPEMLQNKVLKNMSSEKCVEIAASKLREISTS